MTTRTFTPAELERGRVTPALKSAEVECWDHDAPAPCPKCRSDQEWYAKLQEAEALESAARFTRKANLDGNPDIERICVEWDKSASRLRGELQAVANSEPEL